MTNSPPTFQNMMNDILKDVIDKGIVTVFIDNILIFMEDEEHHDEIVEEVLKRLKENDLFAKPEKCEFKKKQIEFLGMIIGEKGVKMDMTKSGSHYVMADAKVCEGRPSIFGTSQLLPPLYSRYLKNCYTIK